MIDHEKIERLRQEINRAILESGATMAEARRAVNMVVTDLNDIQEIALKRLTVGRMAEIGENDKHEEART